MWEKQRAEKPRRQKGSELVWLLAWLQSPGMAPCHQLWTLGGHHPGMGAGRSEEEEGGEEIQYLEGFGTTQKMRGLFSHAVLHHPSVYLPLHPLTHLFIHLFIYLLTYLFIHHFLLTQSFVYNLEQVTASKPLLLIYKVSCRVLL